MGFVERKAVYFDSAGKHNTDVVLKLAKDYAEAENINNIVLASTTGETRAKAVQIF